LAKQEATRDQDEFLTRAQFFSSRYATLVGFLFAIVIGRSFENYEMILFNPWKYKLEFLSLSSLYAFVILSWAGYHQSLVNYPYTKGAKSALRLFFDFITVIIYVYMISSIEDIMNESSMYSYILGYLLSFVAYIFSGLTRRWEYSENASRTSGLIVALVFYSLLYLGYHLSTQTVWFDNKTINWTTGILVLIIFIFWRYWRKIGGSMGATNN